MWWELQRRLPLSHYRYLAPRERVGGCVHLKKRKKGVPNEIPVFCGRITINLNPSILPTGGSRAWGVQPGSSHRSLLPTTVWTANAHNGPFSWRCESLGLFLLIVLDGRRGCGAQLGSLKRKKHQLPKPILSTEHFPKQRETFNPSIPKV